MRNFVNFLNFEVDCSKPLESPRNYFVRNPHPLPRRANTRAHTLSRYAHENRLTTIKKFMLAVYDVLALPG